MQDCLDAMHSIRLAAILTSLALTSHPLTSHSLCHTHGDMQDCLDATRNMRLEDRRQYFLSIGIDYDNVVRYHSLVSQLDRVFSESNEAVGLSDEDEDEGVQHLMHAGGGVGSFVAKLLGGDRREGRSSNCALSGGDSKGGSGGSPGASMYAAALGFLSLSFLLPDSQ